MTIVEYMHRLLADRIYVIDVIIICGERPKDSIWITE